MGFASCWLERPHRIEAQLEDANQRSDATGSRLSQRIAKLRPKTTSKIPLMRRRILMLEDHEGSRYVMRQALTALGHDCKAVSTTRAVLSAIETYEPDVIIYEWYTRTDERIGLSVRLRQRVESTERTIAILILSSIDEPEGFREREAIDAYLTKPMNLAELEPFLKRSRHG
jgi:CheY-like chemotaxis protein